MRDLNDFYYFHAVVTHDGFSAASRHIGVPKGTLSKSVARLEALLQVRLLERSTRKVRPTEVGRMFYEQCESIVLGAEAAEAVAAQAQVEPCGLIRMSCPQGLIQHLLADILPGFLKVHPKVRVQVKAINRPVSLIEEGVDIALRARTVLETEQSLIVRKFGSSSLLLAASPALCRSIDGTISIENLATFPTLSVADHADEDEWTLIGPDGRSHTIRHKPRLLCSNFDMLCAAAIEGLGIAFLPEHICRPAFASGQLEQVLPGWHSNYGVVHAVFPSRKGLVPATRALIDYLAVEVARAISCPVDGAMDSARNPA